MSKFSLDPEMNIEVTARFISKGDDAPITGHEYTVRLYDKDLVGSDFLGESGLDEKGMARIKFSHAAFGEWDSLEKYPDFYFILLKNGTEILHSKVMQDVDVDFLEQFRMGEGEVVELGTFLVGS